MPPRKKSKPTIAKPKRKKPAYPPSYTINFRTKFGIEKRQHMPKKALEHLADILIEWVDTEPNAIDLKVFFNWHRIMGSVAMFKLTQKSDKLHEAYQYAKQKIAANREKLALYRTIDPKVFAFMQHNYDPDWASAEERQIKLKAKLEDNTLTKQDFKEALSEILKPVDKDE